MAFKGLTITHAGEQLIASAVSGNKNIIISSVKIGDGILLDQDKKDMQNMVHSLFNLQPTVSTERNKIYINVQIDNESYDQDFYFREIGIFAKDKENHEFLYAYDNAEEDAEHIVISQESLYEKRLRFCLGYSSDLKIEVSMSGSMYALERDMQEHVGDFLKLSKRVEYIETNGVISGDTLPVGGQFQFEGDVIPTGYKKVTPPFSNPNMLRNAYFPIWQRGNTFNTNLTGQYTSDGWVSLQSQGYDMAEVKKVANGLQVDVKTLHLYGIRQYIEIDESILGKELSLSCMVDGVIYEHTLVVGTSTDNQFVSDEINMSCFYLTKGILAFSVWFNKEKTYIVNWAKCEYGNIVTPFIKLPYIIELEICKYYYMNYPSHGIWSIPYTSDSTYIAFTFELNPNMRVNPTMIVDEGRFERGLYRVTSGNYESIKRIEKSDLLSTTYAFITVIADNALVIGSKYILDSGVIKGLDADIYISEAV